MADIAQLGLRVDSGGVKTAAGELKAFDAQAAKTEKMAMSLVKSLGGLAAGFSIASAVQGAVNANKVFQTSLSQLSAITGATGKDLQFFAEQSKEIGRTTTLSASQAAEAFKLIASAKPDLLANRDALAAVTKEAVALAEAAGIELPQAAAALGNSLNQFGADADQAGRFINVLAAGAKFGSSAITDTTLAMKNAGAAANAVGVSFEAANAGIQALAKGGIVGAEAGTALRNVLLKLEGDTNTKLNPSVSGLTGALASLAKQQLTVTQITEKFGAENVVAVQTLIDNAAAVGELEKQLTGTNTAYEQAKTNNDNLQGAQAALSSAVNDLAISFGDKLNPALTDSTKLLTKATIGISDNLDTLVRIGEVVAVLFAGRMVASFGAAAAAQIAAARAATVATTTFNAQTLVMTRVTASANLAAFATRGLAGAMALVGGPVGLAVSGVTLLATGIYQYNQRAIMAGKTTGELTASVTQMGDAASRAQSRFAGLLSGIQNLTRAEAEQRLGRMQAQLRRVESDAKRFQRMFESGTGSLGMIEGNAAAAELLRKEIDKLSASIGAQSSAQAGGTDESRKAIEAMRQQLELAKLEGVAREKLSAIQRLGVGASEEERAEAERLAAEIYRLNESRKGATSSTVTLTDAQKLAKTVAEDLAKAQQSNADVIADLAEQLYQATLSADELIQRQNQLRLNEFATPEQVAQVRSLTEALAQLKAQEAANEELDRRREEFGSDPAATIRGDLSPLSGGRFDEQTARYEAERQAEMIRYQEQQARLAEALEIELITKQESWALEEQFYQEHSDRLTQIDQARTDMMMENAAQGFAQMSQDIMAFAQVFASENKEMFEVAKAAAIASTIIETITSAQRAFSAMSVIPIVGPALGIAAAAAAVAGGMARVSQIRSQSPSFDGGGFTGHGSRTGGVDGKGGFNAVLHPNETVIDHTKSQAMAGGTPQVVNNFTISGQVDRRTQSQIAAKMAQEQNRSRARFAV